MPQKERPPKEVIKDPEPNEVSEPGGKAGKAGRPLTKSQLAARLAADAGADEATARKFLDALAKLAREEVLTNPSGQLVLPGIGTAALIHTPTRKGINPFTKQEHVYGGRITLKFRWAPAFTSAVLAAAGMR